MILKKLGGYIVAVVYNAVFVFKVLLHLEPSGSQILVEQLVKHRQWQWDNLFVWFACWDIKYFLILLR